MLCITATPFLSMSCISGLSFLKCFPEQKCLWLLLCSITQYPCYVDNSDLCLCPMRHFTNTGLVLSGSLKDVKSWNLPKDNQIMAWQCWFQIEIHHHCSNAFPACILIPSVRAILQLERHNSSPIPWTSPTALHHHFQTGKSLSPAQREAAFLP